MSNDDRQTNDDVDAHRTRTNIRPNHDAILNADITEAASMADVTMHPNPATWGKHPLNAEPLHDRRRP